MIKLSWPEFVSSIKHIKERNPIYFSVLVGLRPEQALHDQIVLYCSNTGAKDYIEKKADDISELLSLYMGKKVKVTFEVETQIQKQKPAPLFEFQPTKEDIFRKAGLRADFTFDNFAVSNTNQIAFAASQSVGNTPGSSYNPLFLYGGVGFGKTHLAQAIAHEVLSGDPEKKIFFCSGEHFMNDLIEAIRGKTTSKFRKKYRGLDVLIVDDIQFIAGKQTVQEEFFHTFNSIVAAHGQVILTSDRSPQEIGKLEDRLRSRFSGGLIVDIQQPDFELRTAILLIKARGKNIQIDINAAKMVAELIVDTRALEGTLLSLYARSLQSDKPINLSLVEELITGKNEKKKEKLSPQHIMKTVCTFYDIKISHLKGPSRKSTVALARQIVMFLLRTELGMNLDEAAFLVNRRDHTTALHAVNKIQSLKMKDPAFRDDFSVILRALQSST